MKFDHIAINVKNIDTSVQWYIDNLNVEVLYKDDTWAVLESAGCKIALTLPSQHPPHIGFVIDEDFRKEKFSDKVFGKHRDGSLSYYAEDPDGNCIEYLIWPK